MEEEYFMQYSIAGLRNGKWYREHPNYESIEVVVKHLRQDRHKLRNYEKLKIQCRKITKWKDYQIVGG